ncbi:LAQU0S21e01310g1_1 [Lachancea quebecensis]|uniref:LAQU0S21e01310g1_1 n=1 Tax=Lachancea quebecensis TaxID=1654605 RepID=A0A0P1KXF0_9SACH|nr:LAQU0S21e01310g1_1 [Lachancea quebecensis]
MSKVILVTGASKGIGRAIVDVLCNSEQDVKVLGIARSVDDLEALKTKYQEKFDYLCADITDTVAISNYVKKIHKEYGSVDAVIANAGVLAPVQSVARADIMQWKQLFDVNFFSIVSLVSELLPSLKKSNQGDVILVSSGASAKPYYAWGAYGASKAALNHFAQTVALEEPQIKTVAVAPGVVNTQMQDAIRDELGPSNMTPEALKRFTDLREKNQLLEPEIPATIYANLALHGIPTTINGKYLRYSDELLKNYR